MSAPLLNQKERFSIPAGVTYLNMSYMSPLLTKAVEAGENGVRAKARPWELSPQDFFSELEVARELFARLIGASPDDVAIVPSATYGVTTASRNLSLRPSQKVLIQAEEFPASYYPIEALTRETGARLETVPRPDNGDWTSAILERLDESVAVVAVSPSHWTDGTKVFVEELIPRCQDYGIQIWVDGCQSIGAAPFNVHDCPVDYLVAPTYKWLLGPYGLAFLYVHPKHHDGQPLEEYWANRAGAEDFSQLVNYRSQYAAGARRFDMGERSNFHTLPIACVALRQLLEWTPDQISNYLAPLTDQLAAWALEAGLVVAPREFRSRHMLGLRKKGGVAQSTLDLLRQNQIHVSVRGDCLRVSPYVYNSPAEMELLARALSMN